MHKNTAKEYHGLVKADLGNIVNSYWVNDHLEVCVQEFEEVFRGGGRVNRRNFVIINSYSGIAEDISEWAAMAMCITPDSTITAENWEDFCTARGIFAEDN